MALDKLNFNFKAKGEEGAFPFSPQIADAICKKIDEIIDKLHPVGEYYTTSNIEFDPNVSWRGKWVKDEDGTVLASKNSEEGSLLNADVDSVVGEEKHTMTLKELAKHSHDYNGWGYQVNIGSGDVYALCKPYNEHNNFSSDSEQTGVQETGESEPFSIVQKTKIVVRWHRIA